MFFVYLTQRHTKRPIVENQAPLSYKCALYKTNEKGGWGKNKESEKYKKKMSLKTVREAKDDGKGSSMVPGLASRPDH